MFDIYTIATGTNDTDNVIISISIFQREANVLSIEYACYDLTSETESNVSEVRNVPADVYDQIRNCMIEAQPDFHYNRVSEQDTRNFFETLLHFIED